LNLHDVAGEFGSATWNERHQSAGLMKASEAAGWFDGGWSARRADCSTLLA
jgi:hypothetical protein